MLSICCLLENIETTNVTLVPKYIFLKKGSCNFNWKQPWILSNSGRFQGLPVGGRMGGISLLSRGIWSGWGLGTGSLLALPQAWTAQRWSSRKMILLLACAPRWQTPLQNTMTHFIYNSKDIQMKRTAVGSFSYLGSWCTLAELAGMRSLYSLWVCLRGWDSLVCRAWCQAEIQLALKEGAKCIFNDPQVH